MHLFFTGGIDMTITELTEKTASKHYLRMPVPESGKNFELFIFSGIAIFNKLKGTGSSWEGGYAYIAAKYNNVIAQGKAILPKHWTVDVHLASISNLKVANNTGWSVNEFSLRKYDNNLGGGRVVVPDGSLVLDTKIAVRDIDAYIHRLSYHVTILGKVVNYKAPETEKKWKCFHGVCRPDLSGEYDTFEECMKNCISVVI